MAIVRFADPIGWVGMPPVSHLSLPGGINDQGDFTNARGSAYLEDMGQVYYLNALLAPEFEDVEVYRTADINNNRQVAGHQAHSFLLTPLGKMIIPGDVNGDVQVNLDDHCAWLANPIDLNGDGVVDAADEQWLIDRLEVFGFTIQDCNGNGTDDHCDITSGFSLDCDGNDVPDECQSDCNGDGVPDVCEPDCNANGVPDPCDILAGTSDDCNGNGIPDECDGGGVSQTSVFYDPPIQILTADYRVEEMLVIDQGIVDDVDFMIDIRYRIGDLTVLLSHNGVTVTLIDRPGHPEIFLGNGQLGYAPALVDDEGTGGPIEDEGNFGSPFEPIVSPPRYTPNEPLSTFDGMPMEGTWTVTIITTDSWSPVDEFFGWGLTLTSAAVPAEPCCQADLNGDNTIDVADLLALLAEWGPCLVCPPADFDGDGSVGVTDLLTMLAAWGPCP